MSQLTTSASGAIKLSQDLSNLVNNPVGSDIRIEVGGGETTLASTSSEKSQKATSSDEKVKKLATATFHAHSAILRFRSKYFSTLYENEWSETTSGVFRKPNISPVVFHALLYYMYTGSVEISNVSLLPEVIAAAEEMELEELSLICQSRLINELKDAADNSNDDEPDTVDQNSNMDSENLSFSLAVRTLLIPALVFAYQHILDEFFNELIEFTVDNIKAIVDAKNAFSAFIEKIPVAVFKQILSADSLGLEEYDIWQLALSWGCHRVELLKSIVEAQVRLNANAENYGDDEDVETFSSNLKEHAEKAGKPLVSDDQLKDLKFELRSLLPTIRFTLMEPDQYLKTVPIFNFFLPSRRLLELQRFFSKPGTASQEIPRDESVGRGGGIPKSKIANRASGELRKWIHDTKAISGCSLARRLKFKLLYRASDNGFQASNFHNSCDNKGPALVLVRSSDGHIFGGVNFVDWLSNNAYTNSGNNFLFALKDGKHRTQSVKFPCANATAAINNTAGSGPVFGNDLTIPNNSNSAQSTSNMPQHYNGAGASNTALAGAQSFLVADYEVFAISKK